MDHGSCCDTLLWLVASKTGASTSNYERVGASIGMQAHNLQISRKDSNALIVREPWLWRKLTELYACMDSGRRASAQSID